MAYNKVDADGRTLIDLTSDTVTADTLVSGRTAHLASGERVTGTFEPVTGVKGNAESTYRKGDVNLTPANIGAATSAQGTKADSAVQTIKMNGSTVTKINEVVNLGTVITAHQDITGKADKSATVSNVTYDTTNKKLTKTINGTTSDVVTTAQLKTDMALSKSDVGLGNVDNTSDANKPISTATQAALDAQQAQIDDNSEISETPDTTPYIYKASEHDALYDELVGGSVAWNQLVQNGNFESTSKWTGRYSTISVSNNVCTVTPSSDGTFRGLTGVDTITDTTIAGHKYLISVDVLSPVVTNIALSMEGIGPQFAYAPVNAWRRCACIWTNTSSIRRRIYALLVDNVTTSQTIMYKNVYTIDLTQMFGTTIADYVYTLEQSTAGSGIAWLKSYGFFTEDYYAYNTGELISVNTSGKKVADENAEITYPIQSIDLRGLYKLDSNNKIYADGDIYSADGTVTREYGYRDYQSGDESLANAITDGTHTIYKLSTPTTETAQPFASPQIVYRNGTEEYLDIRDVPIPVGGNRKYVDIPDWMVNEYFDDLRTSAYELTQDLDDISGELDCLLIQAALVNNEVIIQNTSDFTRELYGKYFSHTKPKFAILELHITSNTYYYKALINSSSVGQGNSMDASFITVNGTYMGIYRFGWSRSGTVGTPVVSYTSLNLGS